MANGDGLVRPEFGTRKLNAKGSSNSMELRLEFSQVLNNMESICAEPCRELSLAKTHLETAHMYAQKALALRRDCQEEE